MKQVRGQSCDFRKVIPSLVATAMLIACGMEPHDARLDSPKAANSIGVPAPKNTSSEEAAAPADLPTAAESDAEVAPSCKLISTEHFAYVGDVFKLRAEIVGELDSLTLSGAVLSDPKQREFSIPVARSGSHHITLEVANNLGRANCDVVLFASQKP